MRFLLKFDPLPSAFTAVTHILSSTSSYRHTLQYNHTTNSPRLQTPFLSQLSTISARWLESTVWTAPELQWTTQTSPVAVADAHEWTKRESKSLGIAKCCEVSKRKQKERWNKEKHTVGPFSFYIPLHKRRSQQRNESETPCRSAWDLASCKFSYGCKLTLLQLRPDAKSMCLEGERSIWAIHLGGLQYYPTAPRYSTWINRDPDAETPYVCVGIRTALRQSSTVAAVDSTCDALQRH